METSVRGVQPSQPAGNLAPPYSPGMEAGRAFAADPAAGQFAPLVRPGGGEAAPMTARAPGPRRAALEVSGAV